MPFAKLFSVRKKRRNRFLMTMEHPRKMNYSFHRDWRGKPMFKIITEDADSQIANFFDWVAVYAGMAPAR